LGYYPLLSVKSDGGWATGAWRPNRWPVREPILVGRGCPPGTAGSAPSYGVGCWGFLKEGDFFRPATNRGDRIEKRLRPKKRHCVTWNKPWWVQLPGGGQTKKRFGPGPGGFARGVGGAGGPEVVGHGSRIHPMSPRNPSRPPRGGKHVFPRGSVGTFPWPPDDGRSFVSSWGSLQSDGGGGQKAIGGGRPQTKLRAGGGGGAAFRTWVLNFPFLGAAKGALKSRMPAFQRI